MNPGPPSISDTSSDLVSRLRVRDDQAWERFTAVYGPLVFYWCQRSRLGDADAADVVQNVFVAVAAAINNYRPRSGSPFRAWLWTITRNKINDHFRVKNAAADAVGGSAAAQRLAQLPDYEPHEETDAQDRDQLSALFHRGLATVRAEFEERTWQAFWRAAVENESTADIGAELGITANAVRQAKSRVLRRLRDQLGDDLR